MIKCFAKSFKDVVVVSNPNDYKNLEEWKNDGGISFETEKFYLKRYLL